MTEVYAAIQQLEEESFPVSLLCECLNVSRSAYYAWRQDGVGARKREDNRLRPGMTARVTIEAGNAIKVLFLPIQAIFNEGSETFCYLAKNHEIFLKKKVVTGRQNEDLVEIVSGLRPGDLVSLLRPPSDQIVHEDP